MKLTKSRKIVIAVAGNPNSGKTTLFNAITGATQKVGNWTGVTVERVEGECSFNGVKIHYTDLPGTYSLSAYSPEEKIARDYLLYEHPDAVLVVLDASNLERNLYLLAQIVDIGHPMVIALNMFDIAQEQGIKVDVASISEILGCPVIPTVGTQNIGLHELQEALIKIAQEHIHPKELLYPDEIEESIDKVDDAIRVFPSKDFKPKCHLRRYIVTRLIEEDKDLCSDIVTNGPDPEGMTKVIRYERERLEKLYGIDIHSILAQARYAWSSGLFEETVEHGEKASKRPLSERIDNVVMNKWLGFPIFTVLMFIIFYLTFTIGGFFAGFLDEFFSWFGGVVHNFLAGTVHSELMASLFSEGIIGGVGGVIVFLPNIFVLFLLIAILEDSGYMARAAFLMDKLMHKFGLHGRSFIPMLLGFGCSVPAILGTRTLRDPRDRLTTILAIPFVPCAARLPVLVLFAALLFPNHPSLVVFAMYFLGIITALLVALMLKKVFLGGLASPFVMELPKYHRPVPRIIFKHTLVHSSAFLRKAGTVILLGAILIWFLGSIPFGVEYASEDSLAGKMGKVIQPVFAPMEIEWQGVVALTFGFVAKEIVISSLSVLYGADEDNLDDALEADFPTPVAWAFLVFTLLYTPCVATLAVIRAETGKLKWMFISAGMSLGIAWVAAFITYWIASI